jgi:hypothetical protein
MISSGFCNCTHHLDDYLCALQVYTPLGWLFMCSAIVYTTWMIIYVLCKCTHHRSMWKVAHELRISHFAFYIITGPENSCHPTYHFTCHFTYHFTYHFTMSLSRPFPFLFLPFTCRGSVRTKNKLEILHLPCECVFILMNFTACNLGFFQIPL